MLLADHKPLITSPYASSPSNVDIMAAALRMARLYYDHHPEILDWANLQGKTALHIAALKGNEELVRMLCDLGADFDLQDNKGNTPLHYASSWGHIPVVQLLIERGCQFATRNNEGFTASDYAYSYSTRDTLQDTARSQFENNKKSRRNVFAQAAARGNEWGSIVPPTVPSKARDILQVNSRMRSGSGTSRTTATSDSGDLDTNGYSLAQSSISSSSSPSHPPHSASSSSFFHVSQSNHSGNISSSGSTGTFSVHSPGPAQTAVLPPNNLTLSPIVTRMRERDADAMEKYMKRNRSGSGSQSTDAKSLSGSNFSSAGPSANGDDITSLTSLPISGSVTPRRRLRPSLSAAQLRTTHESFEPSLNGLSEVRNRSGTSPGTRPSLSPVSFYDRSPSSANSPRMISPSSANSEGRDNYTGPPSQYARFPEPPLSAGTDSSTPVAHRRLPFHILSKPLPSIDSVGAGHRRGSSATSVRGS
jgi:hypothetical protein